MMNLDDDIELDRLSKEAAEAYTVPVTPSWENFVDKLDAAMPAKNNRRKGFFLWTIPLFIAILSTGAYFSWPDKGLTYANKHPFSASRIEKKVTRLPIIINNATLDDSKKKITKLAKLAGVPSSEGANENIKNLLLKSVSNTKVSKQKTTKYRIEDKSVNSAVTLNKTLSLNKSTKKADNIFNTAADKNINRTNNEVISTLSPKENITKKANNIVNEDSKENVSTSQEKITEKKTELAIPNSPEILNTNIQIKDSSKNIKSSTITKIVLSKAKLENFIQIGIGTAGLAAEFRHTFNNQFAIRVGGNYLSTINALDISNGFSINSKSKTNMNLNFSNGHIFVEYAPIKGSGLRVVAGAGQFIKAKASLNSFFVDSLQLANTKKYTPQQIGNLITTIDYRCIAPYLGIGLLKAVSKGRFSINLDAGTYYLAAPSVSISGTKLLSKNARLAPILQKQLVDYRWMPVFQLNLSYKL